MRTNLDDLQDILNSTQQNFFSQPPTRNNHNKSSSQILQLSTSEVASPFSKFKNKQTSRPISDFLSQNNVFDSPPRLSPPKKEKEIQNDPQEKKKKNKNKKNGLIKKKKKKTKTTKKKKQKTINIMEISNDNHHLFSIVLKEENEKVKETEKEKEILQEKPKGKEKKEKEFKEKHKEKRQGQQEKEQKKEQKIEKDKEKEKGKVKERINKIIENNEIEIEIEMEKEKDKEKEQKQEKEQKKEKEKVKEKERVNQTIEKKEIEKEKEIDLEKYKIRDLEEKSISFRSEQLKRIDEINLQIAILLSERKQLEEQLQIVDNNSNHQTTNFQSLQEEQQFPNNNEYLEGIEEIEIENENKNQNNSPDIILSDPNNDYLNDNLMNNFNNHNNNNDNYNNNNGNLIPYNHNNNDLNNNINNNNQSHYQFNDNIKNNFQNKEIEFFNNSNFPWSQQVHFIKKNTFGIHNFRTNQESIINATISGKDVFVLMPTGGGKSLTFMLPALLDNRITIVISPLVSLIQDQVLSLEALNIIAAAFTGGMSVKLQNKIYDELRKKDKCLIQILYCTPEKIQQSANFFSALEELYYEKKIARFVIDEAHCVSQWGHDFRPDYSKMKILKQSFPKVPILALTATATESVKKDIIRSLGIQNCLIYTQSFNRANLIYEVRKKESKGKVVVQEIYDFIQANYKNESGIIYCFTQQDCENLSKKLFELGLNCSFYHGGMAKNQRTLIQKKWASDVIRVLIGTLAFGMGVNKPDVRFVIHYTIPKSLEHLYQESGRAGRDGEIAHCILYFSIREKYRLESQISNKGKKSIKESGFSKLKKVVNYCQDEHQCRRTMMLKYFGENFDRKNCNGTCDNCKKLNQNNQQNQKQPTNTELVDVTGFSKVVLKVLTDAKQLPESILVGILRGSQSKVLQKKKYNKNKFKDFGALKSELKQEETKKLIQKLVEEDVLKYQLRKPCRRYQRKVPYYMKGKLARNVNNGQKKIFMRLKSKKKANNNEKKKSKAKSNLIQPQLEFTTVKRKRKRKRKTKEKEREKKKKKKKGKGKDQEGEEEKGEREKG
ncbi:atp-dependent DNA helicase q-like 4a [Anaeramoeba flamelloides]|uniref:DNA 3'-5' helicase n=1 Tax=Anaeramoeba flamelloides TaxID=1746091 RepID=A0AAV7ZJW6_9EUKA|nr:atp-dependent DNA helicase q-like 4a [Anaeramoeba flamelloides]